MGKRNSSFNQKVITKGVEGFIDANNVYRITIENKGSFSVIAADRSIGSINILPGKENTVIFKADCGAPVPKVSMKFIFNKNAEDSDSVEVIYTTVTNG